MTNARGAPQLAGRSVSLAGRAAVVTGAGSGIGRAIAEAMAQAGAQVIVADIDGGRAEAAAQALNRARAAALGPAIGAAVGAALGAQSPVVPGRAVGFAADVTDPAAVSALIERCRGEFGAIDIVVNNAGLQYVSPLEHFPLEKWRLLLDVMLTGPFLCTQAALPHMRRQGWGRIINIASIHGKVASPFKAAYVAAKHGVIGLTRATAVETAEAGITANAICPGFVDTPLVRNQIPDLMRNFGVDSPEAALELAVYSKTPQRRLLDPAEVAALAVFLASDAAAGITGQALHVDGGMVMH